MMPARYSPPVEAMVDRPMPGGCEHCRAHRLITQWDDGLYALHVVHDAGCPTLLESEGGAA